MSKRHAWRVLAGGCGAALVASVVGVIGSGAPAGAQPPVPSGPGSVWVVSTAGSPTNAPSTSCESPSENTIQAAVDDAGPGDTVYVCSGTYSGSITISTSDITLEGAEYGVPAFTAPGVARVDSGESIIDAPGGITYAGSGLTGEAVSGFELTGYAGSGPGEIQADPALHGVGSAWSFTDNIIDASAGGIGLNTDGVASPGATTISGNEFVQSTPSNAGSGWAGQAVTIWGGSGNNVTVTGNDFDDLTGPGAAVNTTGAGSVSDSACASDPSTGLTVSDNSLEQNDAAENENLVALFCTSGAQVTGNTVTVTNDDTQTEGPIFLGGGDVSPVVSDNTLTGNGAASTEGPGGAIVVSTSFYPTDNATVEGNHVSGWGDNGSNGQGVLVCGCSELFIGQAIAAPSGFSVQDNTVTGNGDGIQVYADSPGQEGYPQGSITDNSATSSVTDDCDDQTVGSGTAGTNDTWSNDYGSTSSPSGLCGLVSSSTSSAPNSTGLSLGNANSDTATVTGSFDGVDPTGHVTFYECGPDPSPTACSDGTQIGGPVALSGSSNPGTAMSSSFDAPSTGYWCFAAVYSGDSTYSGSSDTTTDECYDVTVANSSTSTAPSSSSAAVGGTDSDVATVTGVGGTPPTGSVTFYECGPTATAQPCTSQADEIGSPVGLTPNGADTATATSASVSPSSTGYWCFAGVYAGDGNYSGSSDTSTGECFDVTSATTSLVSAPTDVTISLGQADTDLATITGNATGGSPTGSVTFYACGPTSTAAPCTSRADPVGSAVSLTPDGTDRATATSSAFTPDAVGEWCFAAVYSGDSNYVSSTDDTADECLNVQGPLTIVTSSIPGATARTGYSTPLVARGGTTPYIWTKVHGPHWLFLDRSTGVLFGTPRNAGTFTIRVRVRSGAGRHHQSALATFTLTVTP